MNKICTFEACQNVREAAESKGDEAVLNALISVNYDLVSADAQYHKTCFASYEAFFNTIDWWGIFPQLGPFLRPTTEKEKWRIAPNPGPYLHMYQLSWVNKFNIDQNPYN